MGIYSRAGRVNAGYKSITDDITSVVNILGAVLPFLCLVIYVVVRLPGKVTVVMGRQYTVYDVINRLT